VSIPLLAGPGRLTVTVLLLSKATGTGENALLMAAVFVMYACALVAVSLSSRIKDIIGRTGSNILRRLLV
jgi:multiple antibiotic resistance protein